MVMPPPSSPAWRRHRVTAQDLAPADGAHTAAQSLQWVAVAARAFPELGTVSKAKRARKAGLLLLNGQPRVPTLERAELQDELAYCCPERQHSVQPEASAAASKWLATCQTQGLRIVFEHEELAVVVKPVGVHVKGRGKRTVETALPLLLRLDGAQALPVPHAVHRLDYRVGGLLLVAKTRRAEVTLCKQLERHSVTKQYRAILTGSVTSESLDGASLPLSVELPAALEALRGELTFLQTPIDGKECVTAMRIVETTRSARYDWITTVDLWPLTGRKHQLRVHAASIGHPIVGDDLYHGTAGFTGGDGSDETDVEAQDDASGAAMGRNPVVRGLGLFLFSVGVAFDDIHGNRRNFRIPEPHKFNRFRHFCAINWTRKQRRETSGGQ